jgi:hypothetical protein
MDCYGVGAILHEVLTDEMVGAGEVPADMHPIVTSLLEPDPTRRMTVPEAMLALADLMPTDHRPWPKWADRSLPPAVR